MYMKTQTKSYCCKALTDASTGLYGRCAYQEMKTRNKKKRVLSRTKHSLGVLAFEEPESAGTSKFIPFRCPLYLTNCGARSGTADDADRRRFPEERHFAMGKS